MEVSGQTTSWPLYGRRRAQAPTEQQDVFGRSLGYSKRLTFFPLKVFERQFIQPTKSVPRVQQIWVTIRTEQFIAVF